MNSTFPPLCVALMILFAGMAMANHPVDDPVHAVLFPPEVLIQHREEIGLTDKQVKQIRASVEEVGPQAQEHQMRLGTATGQLTELLSADSIDKETALKQLDEILAIEKDLKHLHLRLMIHLRNELTAKQRQAAAKIQRTPKPFEGLEQRLQAKLSRIEKEVQSRAEAGQPPFEVGELMQKFPKLMQNGQVNEAEALLDRAITMLGVDLTDGVSTERNAAGPRSELGDKMRLLQRRVQVMRQSGEDVSAVQELLQKIGPLMEQRKYKEAEPIVDQALKLLDDKEQAPENKE